MSCLPSIEQDSYGSVEGVAAYARVYTHNGQFDVTTNPTHLTVINWLNQVSDLFNIALADAGFEVPVVQVDAVSSITMMVEQLVADIAAAVNSSGRFFSERAIQTGTSIMGTIRREISDWVKVNASGLELLGVPRVHSAIGKIGFKATDGKGNEIHPIFQRNAFGNRFQDWDK